MWITLIIFAISYVLLVGYTLVTKASLKKRFHIAKNTVDHELAADMREYDANVTKLTAMNAVIGGLAILSFFVM